jgi:nitrite reductase/ring-hydroxylating ferredoxin subunit
MNELYVICGTNEIADAVGIGFTLMKKEPNGEPKPWHILIARKGKNFYGYENACPHQGERLDINNPGHFMDEDENFLECGVHQAKFDLDTGKCFIGPCQGKSLPTLQLVVDDGDLCITGVELFEAD